MNIAYVVHTRFPTEKAHGLQMARVCTALHANGHTVQILAPDIPGTTGDAHTAYALPADINVAYLHARRVPLPGFLPAFLSLRIKLGLYARSIRRYAESHSFDVLYVRSPQLLPVLLETGTPVILELHTLPGMGRARFVTLCNRTMRIVCLTSPMRDELVSWGVDADRITVEGDGVDLESFAGYPEATQAKTAWNLPSDRPVIGYVGSLVARNVLEKGVRELIASVVLLKEANTSCFAWIVGGPATWVETYKSEARLAGLTDEDIRFTGRIDPAQVPSALSACDVLVYPAPKSDHPYFLRDTSPLKLFEYLAAERPVVCADLPPIRDIVDETCVRFCAPGEPESMKKAIQRTLADPQDAAARAAVGRMRVESFTWTARMERIVTGVGGGE